MNNKQIEYDKKLQIENRKNKIVELEKKIKQLKILRKKARKKAQEDKQKYKRRYTLEEHKDIIQGYDDRIKSKSEQIAYLRRRNNKLPKTPKKVKMRKLPNSTVRLLKNDQDIENLINTINTIKSKKIQQPDIFNTYPELELFPNLEIINTDIDKSEYKLYKLKNNIITPSSTPAAGTRSISQPSTLPDGYSPSVDPLADFPDDLVDSAVSRSD